LEKAVVRPRALVIPMAGSKLKFPAVDFTTEVGEVYGGIQMIWMDESEQFTATSGTFQMIDFEAWKLGGRAIVPNELVKDWGGFTCLDRVRTAQCRRALRGRRLHEGHGVKKPLGQLHTTNPSADHCFG